MTAPYPILILFFLLSYSSILPIHPSLRQRQPSILSLSIHPSYPYPFYYPILLLSILYSFTPIHPSPPSSIPPSLHPYPSIHPYPYPLRLGRQRQRQATVTRHDRLLILHSLSILSFSPLSAPLRSAPLRSAPFRRLGGWLAGWLVGWLAGLLFL